MLQEDERNRYEYNLDLAEYLASFWNSEAVQKIRNLRDSKDDDRFASDEEFERQILAEEFRRNDELVQSIRGRHKNTNLQGNTEDRQRDARNTRMPKDMSRLFNIAKDK
jgi:hypothetical protein